MSSDGRPKSVAGPLDSGFQDAPCDVTLDNELVSRWYRIASSPGAHGDESKCVDSWALSSWDRRGNAGHVTIEIVDRSTSMSAVLSWRDPTCCNYGYQAWRRTVARHEGVCALSGGSVRRGDAIFRPALRGTRPTNASAMILAVYIDCAHLIPPRPSIERA
ncbi:DUF3331 domain-containing protein [Paraburkholderia ultramafica]|uniref:DUF3331 domain-containing protein n=1 Tax=Paraburkholderia ultramafica TaxID=1544867 RepID=UPI0015828689